MARATCRDKAAPRALPEQLHRAPGHSAAPRLQEQRLCRMAQLPLEKWDTMKGKFL